MQSTIKTIIQQTDEDLLGIRLEMTARAIAAVLVWVYVAGQLGSRWISTFTIIILQVVQAFLTQTGELFVYRNTRMGDDTSIQLNQTN